MEQITDGEGLLKYPFNPSTILRKKRAIKKQLIAKSGQAFLSKKIAILGGSTTFEIKEILELFLLRQGIQPSFYESEYNKYFEDVMFENPTLREFAPDIVYIHTTSQNLELKPTFGDTPESVQAKLADQFSKFESLWQKLRETYNCLIIQNNFELPANRSLGDLDFYEFRGQTNFIGQLNLKLAAAAQKDDFLMINDIHYLASWIGLERWHDSKIWYLYKYAMAFEAIPHLAHNLAKVIGSCFGKSSKCLVLDLDNTLWGGVIGDDGLAGIKIGHETAACEAHSALQSYVRELKSRGVILTVASKNDFENAKEGFSHPDTVLKYEDFAAFKANWNPKDENIRETALEINIGIDSMVFLDDNPAERELVQQQIPELQVPNIGSEISEFLTILDRSKFFEPTRLSADDFQRPLYYVDNLKRNELKSKFEDYGSFLKSLEMKAEIAAFSPLFLGRITQLVNKTNQFNLTTKRFTEPEIKNFAESPKAITLYGRLLDKFGDNGLVTVLLGEIIERDLHMTLWLMNCRVLKRDLELAMFDALIERARAKNLRCIFGRYSATAKNAMVSNFYEQLGFELVDRDPANSLWKYSIPETSSQRNKYIEVTSE